MRTVNRTAQPEPVTAIPVRPPRAPGKGRGTAKDGGEYSGNLADLTPEARENGSTSPNLGTRPAEIVESAVVPEDLILPEGAAPVIRMVVKEDKIVSRDKHRFKLTAGKIVDSQNYDLDSLRRQGVKLVPESDFA
jgi:hypothetical protein